MIYLWTLYRANTTEQKSTAIRTKIPQSSKLPKHNISIFLAPSLIKQKITAIRKIPQSRKLSWTKKSWFIHKEQIHFTNMTNNYSILVVPSKNKHTSFYWNNKLKISKKIRLTYRSTLLMYWQYMTYFIKDKTFPTVNNCRTGINSADKLWKFS